MNDNILFKLNEDSLSPIKFINNELNNESTNLSILNTIGSYKDYLNESFTFLGNDELDKEINQDSLQLGRVESEIDSTVLHLSKKQHIENTDEPKEKVDEDYLPVEEVEYIQYLNQTVENYKNSMDRIMNDFKNEILKGLDEYSENYYRQYQITETSIKLTIEKIKLQLKNNNMIREKIINFKQEIQSLYEIAFQNK